MLLHELLKVHAADQFHANERSAICFAEVVGLDDVRVNQVGNELGLADEILDEHLLAGEIGANDLDGDAFGEIARAVLLGFIDDAHAAFENFADHVVAEIAIDREQRHGADSGKTACEVKLPWRQKTVIFLCFLLARHG